MKFVVSVKPNWIKRKLRKLFRKPQPNFYYYVKRIEAQAKKLFSHKKTITHFLVWDFDKLTSWCPQMIPP